MKSTLKDLEERLERWIEGSIIRLLGHQIPAASLASQLTEAMKNGLRTKEFGTTHAPDKYRVQLNPETINQLKVSIPELASQLSSGLSSAAREEGILFVRDPQIIIHPETSLAQWEIKVTAWHSTGPLEDTHEMDVPLAKGEPLYPDGAFLIIEGDQHFILDRPIINIGRREDNQLVLNSALVSRNHAQIRARHGRFMLFDLGSKSGTFVHGIPIKQHILRPGDVITISDTHLVYGEETDTTTDETIGFTPIPPLPPNKMDPS
jgi:hypothetical protein